MNLRNGYKKYFTDSVYIACCMNGEMGNGPVLLTWGPRFKLLACIFPHNFPINFFVSHNFVNDFYIIIFLWFVYKVIWNWCLLTYWILLLRTCIYIHTYRQRACMITIIIAPSVEKRSFLRIFEHIYNIIFVSAYNYSELKIFVITSNWIIMYIIIIIIADPTCYID